MTLIELRDLPYEQRAAALRALGQRWTDLLIDLSIGNRPLGHTLDAPVLAAALAPLCHPLLTPDRIVELMTGFAAALSAFDTYENDGTWDDEHNDALACRSPEDRAAFLDDEASWWLFGLLNAAEPCRDCMRTRPFETWQPKQGQYLRCAGHEVTYREQPGFWGGKATRKVELMSKFFDNPAENKRRHALLGTAPVSIINLEMVRNEAESGPDAIYLIPDACSCGGEVRWDVVRDGRGYSDGSLVFVECEWCGESAEVRL